MLAGACFLRCYITSTPLFTFVVIFFSLALKGYFPYVMFLKYVSVVVIVHTQRRRSVSKRGGLIFDSAIHKPLLKFSKMSFASFVGTSKCFCNLNSVYCVRNRFLTMYQGQLFLSRLRTENVRSEVTDVTVIVKYISKSVFRHQNAGGSVPPNFCLGWELRPPCPLLRPMILLFQSYT